MKQISITFLLTMFISMMSVEAFAYEDYDAYIDGIFYNFSDTEAAVSCMYYSHPVNEQAYKDDVVIPSSVTYNGKTYPVTKIESRAFYYCSGLTSVTIPNSVTSIEYGAFEHCTSLTSVTFPDSLTSIGVDAFKSSKWYDKQPWGGVVYAGKIAYKYKGTMPSNTSIILDEGTTGIADGAFDGCYSMTSITIPNSVSYIGNRAFRGCSGLKSFTISNFMTSISYNAFEGCSGLTSVIFHCKDIIEWFQEIKTIKEIAIGDEVETIGKGAFYNCSGLTSVNIPNSVTSIGVDAFYGCSGLVSVTIPNSVTSIGSYAFYECNGLTSVTIPNSVTSIGYRAFYGCDCLASLIFHCKGIDSWFSGYTNIKEITIGDEVGKIGDYAFNDCTGLTSVNIGNSVTSIGSLAFSGCSGLTSIEIPNSVSSLGSSAFQNCSGLTSITIPSSVTSIGSSSFQNCSGLTSITIPNSVTSIGGAAFEKCSGLTSVTIPNSVTTIGNSAFSNCSSLESVTIGTGVLSIGSSIFANHQPAKVIWLTNTPPSGYKDAAGIVNYVANDQYTSLSNKTVHKYLSSLFEVDGVKYVPVSPSERTCDAIDCLYSDEAEDLHIGETVTNAGITMRVNRVHPYTCYRNQHIKQMQLDLKGDVGDYAFYGCAEATSVTLGDKVTGIGQYAFSECSKLGSIVIPNLVTAIGQYTFSGCGNMTQVKIGNGVTTIGNGAFYGCSLLSKITIPQSVTKIDNNVFSGCKALTDVCISDRSTILTLGSNGSSPLFADCPLDSVYIGGNISYSTSKDNGYSPFYRNTSLRSVTITDEETEISPNEFYGCTNLKNVRIGDGVTTIGNWAFSGCSSLDYFAFGSSVETIGQEAFSDCTAMTNLISHADTPPVCGSQALEDINIWTCKLEVPAGNTAAYAAADQWKEFLFVSEGNINERSFYITYMLDGETYKEEKLKYGASITPEPAPVKEGYIFSGWSEIPTTMPAKDVTVTGTFTLSDINDTTGQNRYIVRILSVGGKPRKELQKGVNIVVMSDGTTQKVMVK